MLPDKDSIEKVARITGLSLDKLFTHENNLGW